MDFEGSKISNEKYLERGRFRCTMKMTRSAYPPVTSFNAVSQGAILITQGIFNFGYEQRQI